MVVLARRQRSRRVRRPAGSDGGCQLLVRRTAGKNTEETLENLWLCFWTASAFLCPQSRLSESARAVSSVSGTRNSNPQCRQLELSKLARVCDSVGKSPASWCGPFLLASSVTSYGIMIRVSPGPVARRHRASRSGFSGSSFKLRRRSPAAVLVRLAMKKVITRCSHTLGQCV